MIQMGRQAGKSLSWSISYQEALDAIRKYKAGDARAVSLVHDEIVIEVPREQQVVVAEKLQEMVLKKMEQEVSDSWVRDRGMPMLRLCPACMSFLDLSSGRPSPYVVVTVIEWGKTENIAYCNSDCAAQHLRSRHKPQTDTERNLEEFERAWSRGKLSHCPGCNILLQACNKISHVTLHTVEGESVTYCCVECAEMHALPVGLPEASSLTLQKARDPNVEKDFTPTINFDPGIDSNVVECAACKKIRPQAEVMTTLLWGDVRTFCNLACQQAYVERERSKTVMDLVEEQ